MDSPKKSPSITQNMASSDSAFAQQVQRLYRLTIYGRWLLVCCFWLTIAPLCLWGLREEIFLWQQYFTWVAVRYALFYHPLSTLGLSICIGMTAAVLIWQSRNILFGIPQSELKRLETKVAQIRQQGQSHPLWQWIIPLRASNK
ncbi:hypothetical protein [Calothrix rhizosoleniae]|uniref:hypothetical protein n=1 Tax=Calothrix rhizosoleniae TaxID=888997 RepID=UPI000B49D0D4|nr:hypothetical protein [Calothrix rhizosoleniae]